MARLCPSCNSPLEDGAACAVCGSAGDGNAKPAAGATSYMPSAYWQRMHQIGGLAGVANPRLPETMNYWFYKNWDRRLERFVKRSRLHPGTVFDVGAGTGHWVDWWRGHGAAEVAGCDLVPLAVERLTQRLGPRFSVLDVSAQPISGRYELVSVMNVLLHVTNAQAFDRALANVAGAVAPGGHLLLMEPLVAGTGGSLVVPDPDANSLARPAEAYLAPLRAAGLVLVRMEASTAIGSDPIEKGKRGYWFWRRYWDLMQRGTHKFPRLAPIVGRFMCTADPILLRLGAAPSEKFVLFRRPEDPAGSTESAESAEVRG